MNTVVFVLGYIKQYLSHQTLCCVYKLAAFFNKPFTICMSNATLIYISQIHYLYVQ